MELGTALQLLAFDTGRFPTTAEGLDALVRRPGKLANWGGPYLQTPEVLLDPWGRPYIYRCPGQHGEFDLLSYGADGKEGGVGEAADIVQAGKKSDGLTVCRLTALKFTGATAFMPEQLIAEFPVRIGDPVESDRVEEGMDRIKRLFEEAGYLDFEYTPSIVINAKAKTVAYSFELRQGRQYTVGRINLVGRSSLSDSQLRSALTELGLEEGKIFRPSRLEDAIKRLNRMLGSERLTSQHHEFNRPANRPGTVDITIDLQSKVR
jgi:hypothetical protein